jgi:hypothetical protein
MGIVNRRNAMVGWAVVKLGKRAAKKKGKDLVPTETPSGKVGAGVAAGIAAVFGVLAFWKRRKSGDGE